MEFRDILKRLRSERGISQAELASKLSLSPALIGLYEVGKRKPSYEVIEALSDFFGVSTDFLLGRANEKKTENSAIATVSRNITQLLEKTGKTQLDLAESVGVTQAAVSNWCRGDKMPRISKLDRIAEFFGVSRTQLMDGCDAEYEYSCELKQLLTIFRSLDEEERMLLCDIAKRLSRK